MHHLMTDFEINVLRYLDHRNIGAEDIDCDTFANYVNLLAGTLIATGGTCRNIMLTIFTSAFVRAV